MKKLFLVKKNPELPEGKDNWIVMNGHEFAMFMKTPEGKERRNNFGQLDACDNTDTIIIAECGQEKAKEWRVEKDRHDYLIEAKEKAGYTTFSYHSVETDNGDDLVGDDLICDEVTNVEDTVTTHIMKEKLREAMTYLNGDECHLIEKMFLSDNPMTETEYGKLIQKSRTAVRHRKFRILNKLKVYLTQKNN